LSKKVYIPLIIVVTVAVAAMVVLGVLEWTGDKKAKAPDEVDVEYLEQMQLNPPEDYIQELMSIVENNKDPYTRERAIFALTDIAIRKYETEKIIDFLKDVAVAEEEDNVRTAAYANIDLTREIYPLEKKTSLELAISGHVKKNSNIKLIATISSKVDAQAVIGIDYLHTNIELLSLPYHKVDLKADETQKVEFDLRLKETGEYFIPVTLILSFDRIDHETIEDEVHIIVGEFGGKILSYED